MIDATFVINAPTRAFLGYGTDEREVTLMPGTRLRFLRAGGWGDPCSDIYLDWYDYLPLSGPLVGRTVAIEDAATPRDENARNGYGPIWGPRGQLGPPDSVVLEIETRDELAPNGQSLISGR